MDLIRSTLQPLTHNLPAPVRDLGVDLLGAACYESLLIDIDPSNQECLKLAVSKALGLGIVGASSIVKVPQIAKLLTSRSADGVSFLSYLLESTSYLIGLAYNYRSQFPFSTYGESALILAQNIAIAVLVLRFSGRGFLAALFVAGMAVAAHALFSGGVVDMAQLGYLQAGAGTLGVVSKLPQIYSNWKQGSTGQLSAFTVFNYLLGSLTRIFTTIQEVDDKMILYGFVAGFALNAVLATQMVYYWNAAPAKSVAGKGKGKGKKAAVANGNASAANGSPAEKASGAQRKGPTTRRRG